MFSRPEGLTDEAVGAALATGWAVQPAAIEYRAVGFGSYHWAVTGRDGARWFVTADDLSQRLRHAGDTRAAAFARLRAALATARAAADAGLPFVVAPVPGCGGDVLRLVGEEWALAVYPLVTGQTHDFGDTLAESDRAAVVRLLATLHDVTCESTLAEDFTFPFEPLDGLAVRWENGPYGERARRLLNRHARDLASLLERRDRLAARGRTRQDRMVLTHGEPHPGNLIRSPAGWLLVDWDTALVAPPERDLWLIGEPLRYTRLTGREVLPEMLDYYRLNWRLTDIAMAAARFRGPHSGSADDRVEWQAFTGYLSLAPASALASAPMPVR
jgi:aminoglycoside phosphotransferase (APT) family kinase protein